MSNRRMLLTSLCMAILGWGSLMYFTYAVRPNAFTIGVALVLLFLASLGTVMPILFYLNLRFGDQERHREHPSRPLRQSILLTSYATLCVLLQVLGLLNWAFALFILGAVVMAEVTMITWFD